MRKELLTAHDIDRMYFEARKECKKFEKNIKKINKNKYEIK